MLIIRSNSQNIYRNLATEEYLLNDPDTTEPTLFLWQSDCAVVMGKNQNPWRECRLDRMREEKVPLARRLSGGGTVYHDLGNLNYCVITERTSYCEQTAYEMVIQTLARFDISTSKEGKSNLCTGGRKFSGNAFCFRKNRAMHHGTLLVETDLARLNRYLGSMLDGIETHAIRSIPATVCNLKECCPSLTTPTLMDALEATFCRLYGHHSPLREHAPALLENNLSTMEDRQRANSWIYGATPRFTITQQGIEMEVVKGIIVSTSGPRSEILLNSDFASSAFSSIS